MGIMRRRMRRRAVVAGAAAAGVAYHAGKSRGAAQAEEPYEPQQYVPPSPAPAPPPAADPVAELQRLGELHSQGILTDDEFTAAKAKVLNA
jgi:putative oligomerization/nucleic acid binding protein